MYETTPELIWWNGQIVPWDFARVHVASEVATRGINLFEGIRAYWQPAIARHALVYKHRHMHRLRQSARMARFPQVAVADEIDALDSGCDALLKALDHVGHDVYLRPTVYIDTGRYGYRDGEVVLGSYISGYQADSVAGQGMRCIVSSWRRTPEASISPLIKVGAAYQAFRLPRIEAECADVDEAILLNHRDTVAETGGAAVFLVCGGQVITPPLADGVLDGITRTAVMKLAADHGYRVIERSIPRSQLYAADEIFLAGTLDEIRPVVSVDGIPVGAGVEGVVSSVLREAYVASCRGYAAPVSDDMLHPVLPARLAADTDCIPPSRWTFPIHTGERLVRSSTASVALSAAARLRPSCVLFDIGLTFIHPSGKVLSEEIRGIRPDYPATALHELVGAFVLATEARHLPVPVKLDGEQKVARMLGHYLQLNPYEGELLWRRLMTRHDLYSELDPDALTTIAGLRDQGLMVGAVSNSDGTLVDELRHFGLHDQFDIIIDSGVVGAEKPEQRIFKHALAELNITGEQCCFVGDGPVNDLIGANLSGISMVVLYDRYGVYGHIPALARIRELRELLPMLASPSGAIGN